MKTTIHTFTKKGLIYNDLYKSPKIQYTNGYQACLSVIGTNIELTTINLVTRLVYYPTFKTEASIQLFNKTLQINYNTTKQLTFIFKIPANGVLMLSGEHNGPTSNLNYIKYFFHISPLFF